MKLKPPTKADSKNNMHEMILNVAQQTFEKFGFKKTTIDDIATALRKGKSSIYYYFASKEEIFKAVLDKEAEELKDQILLAINEVEDPKTKIRVYIEVRIEAIKKLGNLYDFQKSNYFSLENVEKLRAKYDNLEVEVLQEILDLGVSQGDFEIQNTQMTAISIMTIIKGLEIPILIETDETIKERLEEMLPILFHGICKD